MSTNTIVATILTKALEAAEKTGEFVMEQAPDLIHQLVLFNTVKYAVCTLIGLALLAGAGWCFLWAWRACTYYGLYDVPEDERPKWLGRAARLGRNDAEMPLCFGGMLTGIFGVATTLSYVPSLLKITLAPKVWLLEYAASLVRNI